VVQTLRTKVLLDDFIKEFEIQNLVLNKSNKTISWYSNNLKIFGKFLRTREYSCNMNEIGMDEVNDFILYLRSKNKYEGHPIMLPQEKKLSDQTILGYVQTLKSFFGWLERSAYIDNNPVKMLGRPKISRKRIEVLSRREIYQVLSAIDLKTPVGIRDTAIVMTLLDTGLRCAELANLKMEDTHIEQRRLKVMGKGARERVVPIGSKVQAMLLRYIHHFRPEPTTPDVDNVFLTAYGRPITVNGIQLMLKRLAKRSGINRLHAHLCRHTFATHYLENGGNVFSLQSILGHSSLEMVRRYLSLSSDHIVAQHQRFSPLDKISPEYGRHQ
jgi:site-specific recombinase XerD